MSAPSPLSRSVRGRSPAREGAAHGGRGRLHLAVRGLQMPVGGRSAGQAGLGQAELYGRAGQVLLGPVVQFAFDPLAFGLEGLDQPEVPLGQQGDLPFHGLGVGPEETPGDPRLGQGAGDERVDEEDVAGDGQKGQSDRRPRRMRSGQDDPLAADPHAQAGGQPKGADECGQRRRDQEEHEETRRGVHEDEGGLPPGEHAPHPPLRVAPARRRLVAALRQEGTRPPLLDPAEDAPPQRDQGEGDEAREGRRRQEQTRDKVEDSEPRQGAGQKALRRPAQRGEEPDAFLFHESIIPGGAACRLTGAGRRGLSLRSARANPDAHRVGDRGDWRP